MPHRLLSCAGRGLSVGRWVGGGELALPSAAFAVDIVLRITIPGWANVARLGTGCALTPSGTAASTKAWQLGAVDLSLPIGSARTGEVQLQFTVSAAGKAQRRCPRAAEDPMGTAAALTSLLGRPAGQARGSANGALKSGTGADVTSTGVDSSIDGVLRGV